MRRLDSPFVPLPATHQTPTVISRLAKAIPDWPPISAATFPDRNWLGDGDKAPPHSGQMQFAIKDMGLYFDSSRLSILKNVFSTNIA